MSTAKRQNIDGGCKQEFTLKTQQLGVAHNVHMFLESIKFGKKYC